MSLILYAAAIFTYVLKHIRAYLSLDTAISVDVCIVATRLDYYYSLLYSTSNRNLDMLQHIHNLLARTVANASWSDSATVVTRSLHWLPIRQRIQFTHCCLRISKIFYPVIILPGSLGPLQFISFSNRQLIPTLHHEPSLCRFHCLNSHKPNIRSNDSSASFKSQLKTTLFLSGYGST